LAQDIQIIHQLTLRPQYLITLTTLLIKIRDSDASPKRVAFKLLDMVINEESVMRAVVEGRELGPQGRESFDEEGFGRGDDGGAGPGIDAVGLVIDEEEVLPVPGRE